MIYWQKDRYRNINPSSDDERIERKVKNIIGVYDSVHSTCLYIHIENKCICMFISWTCITGVDRLEESIRRINLALYTTTTSYFFSHNIKVEEMHRMMPSLFVYTYIYISKEYLLDYPDKTPSNSNGQQRELIASGCPGIIQGIRYGFCSSAFHTIIFAKSCGKIFLKIQK